MATCMQRTTTPVPRSVAPDQSLTCHTCSRPVTGFESVHYGSSEGSYQTLCNRCFNLEGAATGGIAFSRVTFEPLDLLDAAGQFHRFHFEVRLLGDRVSLDAFELVSGFPDGYQFQVIGDAQADIFELMGRMVPRIRRLITQQHLEINQSTRGLRIADLLVRGRVTSSVAHEDQLPVLVIDGREITWEDFGRMLMCYEGFQFKLDIRDRSKEI